MNAKKLRLFVRKHRFGALNAALMILVMLITVYPMWFCVVNSLNEGTQIVKGYSFWWPAAFTWDSWRTVLADSEILLALLITSSRTVIVTVVSSLITAMFAYAFSRPYLSRKKFYTGLGFVSMYFSGGIIPTFLLYRYLGLYNTYWVYIVPFLFCGFYNVIIFNANYKAIPDSLFEAAKMDGASEYVMFWRIAMPLGKPVLVALGVFTACYTWNDYVTTLFYTQSGSLQTLAHYTLKVVKSSQAAEQLKNVAAQSSSTAMALINAASGKGIVTSKTIELSVMVLTAIPMIVMYVFAQRFFTKGIMVGSVKG